MNGKRIFADTNIIIYLLQGHPQIYELLNDREIWLSVITEIELLSYPTLTLSETRLLKDFLSECRVIDINRAIKEKTIEIKRSAKVKLPDALIAASASYLNVPLLTADKGFNKIKDMVTIIVEI